MKRNESGKLGRTQAGKMLLMMVPVVTTPWGSQEASNVNYQESFSTFGAASMGPAAFYDLINEVPEKYYLKSPGYPSLALISHSGMFFMVYLWLKVRLFPSERWLGIKHGLSADRSLLWKHGLWLSPPLSPARTEIHSRAHWSHFPIRWAGAPSWRVGLA